MSRKYSIGFLIGMIVFISIFVIGYRFSYEKAIEKNNNIEEEFDSEYAYVLKDKSGYLTVYKSNGQVYEYTSILSSDLPIYIQEDLEEGIEVENIGEVYGFLENYSS